MVDFELFGNNHGHRFYTGFVRATIDGAEIGDVVTVELGRSEVAKFRMTASHIYGKGRIETNVKPTTDADKCLLLVRRIG